MKVRLACVDDLNEIMELYHLVSDMMEDSAYDIGWRKDVYPTKEIVLLDIEQQTLYVLEKNEKIIGAIVLNHEYEECYQNIYWQIYAEDEEVTIIHRFCIHPDYRGCGKYLLKQIIIIKIFIEIVDAGSFAQAAENLQIHRPAVTKALQQLEQESGVRLLQRTTRRLYLTPEGEEFYRRSKPLLSQADDLLESFAPDRPIRGQLRVDMPIAFARLLVIPHLPDFYQAHPEVEIVLSSSDVRRDMLRDGLDCLLRVGDLEDGDYVARSLGEVALTTCASPGYLARYGAPATLEDLQSHLAVNWVNSSSRQIMPWRFQTPEGIRQIAIPGKLVLDNSEVFTAAGLAGLGMLQGMRFFLQPYIDSGQLVEVLPDFPAPRRPLSLLYPHRHLSHKVRVFADWLQGLVATLD